MVSDSVLPLALYTCVGPATALRSTVVTGARRRVARQEHDLADAVAAEHALDGLHVERAEPAQREHVGDAAIGDQAPALAAFGCRSGPTCRPGPCPG